MEFVSGLLTGMFAFPILVWTSLAWWALIPFLACIVMIEAFLYNEKDGWAGVWLLIVAIFLGIQFAPETDGFFSSVWAVATTTLVGIIDYIIIGLCVWVPLWLLDYRKMYVNLRTELTTFIQQCAAPADKLPESFRHTQPKNIQSLSEDERRVCKEYRTGQPIPEFLRGWWSEYRNRRVNFRKEDTRVVNNLDTIASYAFLWPFHLITRFFGDIITKIPEWFTRVFGRLIDRFAETVLRWGIPKGIDD